MTELATPTGNEASRVARFISRGDTVAELSHDLDNAFTRGDVPVARELSSLLMEIEERRGVSMSLARAYLKDRSLPVFEAYQTLRHGREIDDVLGDEIDDAYEDTAEHIAVLLKERRSLPMSQSEYYRKVRKELTGGITELATFALINRNGRYLNFLLTPTTDEEDDAGLDEYGKNKGFDFRAFPLSPYMDLETPVKLQIKTGRDERARYQDDILVVPLGTMTPEPLQVYKELPQAIVNSARGEETREERFIIGQTAFNLSNRLWLHHAALLGAEPQPAQNPDSFIY